MIGRMITVVVTALAVITIAEKLDQRSRIATIAQIERNNIFEKELFEIERSRVWDD